MSVDTSHELLVFAATVCSGIICSMIFDMFRAFRRIYKNQSTLIIGISDIIFWILSCSICYACIFFFNNGKLRAFEFISVLLGGFIYFLAFSKVFNIVFVNFFKILRFIFKILLTPPRFLYKILLRRINKD